MRPTVESIPDEDEEVEEVYPPMQRGKENLYPTFMKVHIESP
jgi:hypothetical protein